MSDSHDITYSPDGSIEHRDFIVPSDNTGYSLRQSIYEPGSSLLLEYPQHVSALWVMGGEGYLELLPDDGSEVGDGIPYALAKGVAVVMNNHDRFILGVEKEGGEPLVLIEVVSPGVDVGKGEVPGEDGIVRRWVDGVLVGDRLKKGERVKTREELQLEERVRVLEDQVQALQQVQ